MTSDVTPEIKATWTHAMSLVCALCAMIGCQLDFSEEKQRKDAAPADSGGGPQKADGSTAMMDATSPNQPRDASASDALVPSDASCAQSGTKACGTDGNVHAIDGCGNEREVLNDCCGQGCANGTCAARQVVKKACYQGNVWGVDGCGQPVTLTNGCCGAGCVDGTCQPPSKVSVTCARGDLYDVNSCGAVAALSQSCCGRGCVQGACNAPDPQAQQVCSNGDVYYANSCGAVGALKQSCCGRGCLSGICNPVDPQASTTCFDGDVYYVDSCGVRTTKATECGTATCLSGACTVSCPAQMVQIPGTAVCIDKFEVQVRTASDCSGSPLTSITDKTEFPNLVASSKLTGTVTYGANSFTLTAPTLALYACSIEGAPPVRGVSYFQATRLCENVGKRLCTASEWGTACGPLVYAYGNTADVTACNMAGGGATGPANTAAYPKCQGGRAGLFDMHGNLREWTNDCSGCCCNTRGGQYNDPAIDWTCTATLGRTPNDLGEMGFRCCKDV